MYVCIHSHPERVPEQNEWEVAFLERAQIFPLSTYLHTLICPFKRWGCWEGYSQWPVGHLYPRGSGNGNTKQPAGARGHVCLQAAELSPTSAVRLWGGPQAHTVLLLLCAPIWKKPQYKGLREMVKPPPAWAWASYRDELNLSSAATSYVNGSLHLCKPHFPHLYNRANNACLPGLSWGLNEIMRAKSTVQALSTNGSSLSIRLVVLPAYLLLTTLPVLWRQD